MALSAWQPSARIRLCLSSNQNISFFVPQMLSCLHWCCYALQAFLFIKFREKRALYCFAPTNPKAKPQKSRESSSCIKSSLVLHVPVYTEYAKKKDEVRLPAEGLSAAAPEAPQGRAVAEATQAAAALAHHMNAEKKGTQDDGHNGRRNGRRESKVGPRFLFVCPLRVLTVPVPGNKTRALV